MTRLLDLSPEFSQHYVDHDKTPDKGGIPIDEYTLKFTCPSCGPPYQILIKIGKEKNEAKSIWQCSPMPNASGWMESVTIVPSINNTKSGGHGRKHPTCNFHGSIIGGKIVDA
jgi:hypothetical protein